MLQISGLTKSYGERVLLDNVSFNLRKGERLGLVGRNGCGKSTLFRMILGEEHPDTGSIVFPKDYTVGHLAQHLEFHQPNILQEACLGLPEHERHEEYRAEIILGGLGFSLEDMTKPASAFSGGFQIRLNLAKLLLSQPNLLLLDEPTNYLDIVSIKWLTEFLRSWDDELVIISHDRVFMDSVTTDSMLIHRGTIKKMPGNTEKLYTQVLQDEEIYEKTRQNEQKKRKELEVFIDRFRAKASKASVVQSRVKALARMEDKQQLSEEDTLDFYFSEAPFPGKRMATIQDVSFNYPDGPTLISDLSLTIGARDRICIVGKNGKGKSTLLRIIAEDLKPTSGDVQYSPNTKIGYFGQTNISRLNAKSTIEEEIESANIQLHRTRVRAICGTMMFEGDDALKKISVLSGGEKSRVLLGKILATQTNMLLLDEPTNHLDMDSIEALLESLKNYNGAVIIVTHSELLLSELATRLIVFRGDKPELFEHDYQYFLDSVGWDEEDTMTASMSSVAPKKADGGAKVSQKQIKQMQKKVSTAEKKLETVEKDLKTSEQLLAKASSTGDVTQIATLAIKIKDQKRMVDEAYSDLEKVYAEYEGFKA